MGVIISREQNGPIRAEIELNGPALRLFSKADQNTIMRTTMRSVGELFIAVFLPKRFTDYARTFLGYFSSGVYDKRKSKLAARGVIPGPQPTPLVYTGVSRSDAISGARATSTATASNAWAIVRFPRGGVNFKKAAVLQTIPRHEVERMAEEVRKILPMLINSGNLTGLAKGPRYALLGATSRRAETTTPRRVG